MRISSVGSDWFNHLHQKGMSLIELLVVLSIISAVLYVVTPNFHGSLDSLRMKQVVRNIVSDIRMTRINAVKTGQQQTWTLDLENHQFWSSFKPKKTSYPNEMNIVFTTASQEQVTGQIASIRFFPAGGATGAKLELTQNNMGYSLEVDWLTGMVRIHD